MCKFSVSGIDRECRVLPCPQHDVLGFSDGHDFSCFQGSSENCQSSPSLTFRPLALLMALRGRSTRRTRRIFTTEMADDLQNIVKEGVSQVTFYQNLSWDIKQSQHLCSLDAKGDEGNSHHQQVQEVEVIPTERSFMEEGSVCGHLRMGGGGQGIYRRNWQKHSQKEHMLSYTHTHTRSQAHPRRRLHVTLHMSEQTPLKHIHVSTHMRSHTRLLLPRSHAWTHLFCTLIRGGELSETGGQNLTPPPLRPLRTWM